MEKIMAYMEAIGKKYGQSISLLVFACLWISGTAILCLYVLLIVIYPITLAITPIITTGVVIYYFNKVKGDL